MLKGKTVLLAEDDQTMFFFVSNVLKRELNCETILMCESGSQALTSLKNPEIKKTIDLILCDWEMPGASGEEVLRLVREDKDIRNLPFIMTTSRSDKESLIKVAKLGINDYLIKPFSAADLIERIEKVLSHKTSKTHKNFNSATAPSVEITTDDGANSYNGTLFEISLYHCLVRSQVFSHGLHKKVGLQIKFINELISLKTKIQKIEPDREESDSKIHMMVDLKIIEIDEENKAQLNFLLQ